MGGLNKVPSSYQPYPPAHPQASPLLRPDARCSGDNPAIRDREPVAHEILKGGFTGVIIDLFDPGAHHLGSGALTKNLNCKVFGQVDDHDAQADQPDGDKQRPCPLAHYTPFPRMRGSSVSRRTSPTRFHASTNSTIASPG